MKLVNDSIKMTRDLARGLLPVVSEAHGLMSALEHWAGEVSELFHVACRFECRDAVSRFTMERWRIIFTAWRRRR